MLSGLNEQSFGSPNTNSVGGVPWYCAMIKENASMMGLLSGPFELAGPFHGPHTRVDVILGEERCVKSAADALI